MLSITLSLLPCFPPQPSLSPSPPLYCSPPSDPQVLSESALKHWSRVKRYVAQDGSG